MTPVLTRAGRVATVAALVAGALAGCGKRGNPLPPLRPAPGSFTDVQARRIGDRVEIRFSIPAKNADGTVPAAIERVDIYAAVSEPPFVPPPKSVPGQAPGAAPAGAAATPPPGQTPPPATTPPASQPPPTTPLTTPPAGTPEVVPPGAPQPSGAAKPPATPPITYAKLQEAANLRGHIDVRRVRDETEPAKEPKEPAAPDKRPVAGDVVSYTGSIAADRGAGPVSPTAVLQYLLVGIAPARRTPSNMITVPLTPAPDPPGGVTFTYDEKTLTLAWTSAAAAPTSSDVQFRVYDVDETGHEKDGRPIGAAPLKASPFTTPVEFGRLRCFAVHAVRVVGTTAIESDASAPVCQTPVDTFPPPAPALHPAVPSPGSVNLIWDGVEAADLAGYFVLRSDGADETLHPLTAAPITGTIYRDETPRAGVKYVYAIVAVDKAGNLSAQSNRVEIIGR